MKVLFLFFVMHLVFAEPRPAIGTYSGFSETHSTVAFKLMEDGQALVTTDFYDGEGDKRKVIVKRVKGSWTYKEPMLTITFGKHTDYFKKRTDCYESRPCFRFDKSIAKEKSPLNVEYEFVNWDAKRNKR